MGDDSTAEEWDLTIDAEAPWWHYKPPGEWTVDDLDRIPARRVELIDGSPHILSPAVSWHNTVRHRLANLLERVVPLSLHVTTGLGLRLGPKQQPEPDLALIAASALDFDADHFAPADAALIAEVSSQESREWDWEMKPAKYARAGIPHMWIIERDGDRPVVHTFDLVDGAYQATGVHAGRLEVTAPAVISVDIAEITPR